MPIWDERHETMERAALEALQLERLRRTVASCYDNVPLYRERLDAAGVRPGDITTLADVARLPFTTKDDFRTAYPYGLFAVPLERGRRGALLVGHDRHAGRRRLHAVRS